MAADRVTRFAADLVDAAAVEGARHSRSAKQQLDHWARVGRTVSSHHSTARRRVEAALEGRLALTDLTTEERLVANAEADAAIAERLRTVRYGDVLAAGVWRPSPSTTTADSCATTPTVRRHPWTDRQA